jgi:hypothetical protein
LIFAENEMIFPAIDRDNPTIIAGDFTSLSEFTAPKTLRQLGLVDTFAAVNADADKHPTWSKQEQMGLRFPAWVRHAWSTNQPEWRLEQS